MGGTHSLHMCFLLKNNTKCSASHISGSVNYIADCFSRSGPIPHDNKLDHNAFSDLMSFINFPPTKDVFGKTVICTGWPRGLEVLKCP